MRYGSDQPLEDTDGHAGDMTIVPVGSYYIVAPVDRVYMWSVIKMKYPWLDTPVGYYYNVVPAGNLHV